MPPARKLDLQRASFSCRETRKEQRKSGASFFAVNEGVWALATQQIDPAGVTSVGIVDGSAAYLRFGVAANTIGGGRIASRGAPVPPGFALSILRTK